jgi:hypothetical protein
MAAAAVGVVLSERKAVDLPVGLRRAVWDRHPPRAHLVLGALAAEAGEGVRAAPLAPDRAPELALQAWGRSAWGRGPADSTLKASSAPIPR